MKSHVDIDDPLLDEVGQIADLEGLNVFVVGGYVRDLFRGERGKDLDIVVAGDGIAFARTVGRRLHGGKVVTFDKFGTAMLHLNGRNIEFVGARTESYDPSSRKPSVEIGTIDQDLARRDFTVNAMAVCLNGGHRGELRDPFHGREDLLRRILRTPLQPALTFSDDPLRIMRAIRFSSQLDFQLDPETERSLREMKDRLKIVSQERITEELVRILRTKRPSVGLRLMHDTGILDLVFRELEQMSGVDQRRDHHHKDVLLHTLMVVDNVADVSDKLWLRFAALVHDIAKPRTKAYKPGTGWTFHGHEEVGARMMKGILRRLRLPLEQLPYVEKLVRLHLRPMALVADQVTDSAVRRLVFDAGEDIDDLMILCRADITSKNPRLVSRYLRNYDLVMMKVREIEEKDRLRNWQPPVRGDEIMQVCGIGPGRKVGELKKAIEEAILDGKIPNEHDAALQFLLEMKDKLIH